MFTFEKALDFYTSQTKAVLNYVQPESLRETLNKVVDVQESFAKSVTQQAQLAADYVAKHMQEAAKTDWTKFFPISK